MASKVESFKKLLFGSALAATLLTGVSATQAAFAETAPATVNVGSGTLTIKGEGTPRVTADGKTVTDMITSQRLFPNAVTSNTYKVTNSGNLRMVYTISTASASSTPSNIAQRARVTVKAGSEILYTGSLSTLSTPGRNLNAGQSETLTIETSIPVESYAAASDLTGVIDQNTRIQVSGKVAS